MTVEERLEALEARAGKIEAMADAWVKGEMSTQELIRFQMRNDVRILAADKEMERLQEARERGYQEYLRTDALLQEEMRLAIDTRVGLAGQDRQALKEWREDALECIDSVRAAHRGNA